MRRASWVVVAAVVAGVAVSPRQAHAQLGWTVYGAGEFDTNDVVLVLGGVDITMKRSGWTPLVGVQALWLRYGPSGATTSVTSITPSVGMQHTTSTGMFLVRAGYNFQNSANASNPGVFADVGKDGIIVASQLEYWGTGALGAQAIASYNFGSETFWGRGRVTARVARIGDVGTVRVGPEFAYLRANRTSQGTVVSTTTTFDAAQVGGVVAINPGRGVALTGRVGRKISPLSNRTTTNTGDATYFGFEIALFPK